MQVRTAARLTLVEPWRAFARNKVRSGLAALGIMSGVAIVICVIAIGSAGTASALAALDNLGDNLVWIEAGSRNAAGVRTGSHGMTTLVPSDAEAIRKDVPLIARVSENVDGRIQVIYGGNNWNTQYRGVSPDYREIRKWEVARGAFFSEEDVRDARTVIVIGDSVRRKLFGDDDPLGAEIRIGASLYEVVGVLGVKGQSATGNDQDDTLMMPWTTAMRRVVGRNQTWLDDIVCSAVAIDKIREAGAQASELLRERHHIQPGADDDFNIRHPEDLLKSRVKSAETLQILLLVIGTMSLLVGGIGIMNVMLASVSQRTAEIGIRMAVGASPGAIRLQFLGEAVVLTMLSGGLGVLLAASAGPSLAHALGWELAMSARAEVISLGFAAAVGIAFGMYPAVRASRLDPIAALRTDT